MVIFLACCGQSQMTEYITGPIVDTNTPKVKVNTPLRYLHDTPTDNSDIPYIVSTPEELKKKIIDDRIGSLIDDVNSLKRDNSKSKKTN